MILSLPLSLPDATPIGDQHAMQTRDGITYYFYNLQPYDCHPAGDRRAMLLRAAKLQVVSRVRQRGPHACLPGLADRPWREQSSDAIGSTARTRFTSRYGGAGAPSSTPSWRIRRPTCWPPG